MNIVTVEKDGRRRQWVVKVNGEVENYYDTSRKAKARQLELVAKELYDSEAAK